MTHGSPAGHDPELMFRAKTARVASRLSIHLEGRLDGRSGHHLLDITEQFTRAGDEVVIDLTALSYMDRDGATFIQAAEGSIRALGATSHVAVSDERHSHLLRRERPLQPTDPPNQASVRARPRKRSG